MAIYKHGQEDKLCVIFPNDRRQRLSNAFALFLVRYMLCFRALVHFYCNLKRAAYVRSATGQQRHSQSRIPLLFNHPYPSPTPCYSTYSLIYDIHLGVNSLSK